eukprot:gene31948-39467_t
MTAIFRFLRRAKCLLRNARLVHAAGLLGVAVLWYQPLLASANPQSSQRQACALLQTVAQAAQLAGEGLTTGRYGCQSPHETADGWVFALQYLEPAKSVGEARRLGHYLVDLEAETVTPWSPSPRTPSDTGGRLGGVAEGSVSVRACGVAFDLPSQYRITRPARLRRALLDNAAAALLITTPERTIALANQRAVETFSEDGLPLQGKSTQALHRHEASYAQFRQYVDTVRLHGAARGEKEPPMSWFLNQGSRQVMENKLGNESPEASQKAYLAFREQWQLMRRYITTDAAAPAPAPVIERRAAWIAGGVAQVFLDAQQLACKAARSASRRLSPTSARRWPTTWA